MSEPLAVEHEVAAALQATPPRIPVVLGACGSGRTTLLRTLQQQRGARSCQYVDVERAATTPERFYRALISTSPFRLAGTPAVNTPRDGFNAVLAYLTLARTEQGAPATFLLDEVLELRTFESFPGLRKLLPDLLSALAGSQNAFVLSTRFAHRAERLLRDPGVYAIVRMRGLGDTDIRRVLGERLRDSRRGRSAAVTAGGDAADNGASFETARVVRSLSDGRAAYVADLCDEMAANGQDGVIDPISALTALLARTGRLSARCRFCYELRLHRARGYGALKAILDILAEENGLTLTEIAQRLHRTPGSTKDYLSWLEDVDLVAATRKRYGFADPVLRLWVRLHCRPVPPRDEEVAREVQRYALERLAQVEPAGAYAG
jgi:hypothetical protein